MAQSPVVGSSEQPCTQTLKRKEKKQNAAERREEREREREMVVAYLVASKD